MATKMAKGNVLVTAIRIHITHKLRKTNPDLQAVFHQAMTNMRESNQGWKYTDLPTIETGVCVEAHEGHDEGCIFWELSVPIEEDTSYEEDMKRIRADLEEEFGLEPFVKKIG